MSKAPVLAALVGLAVTANASAQTLVQQVPLTGTIRDFRVSHPDFETYPGKAHAGIVLDQLGEDGKPVLNPAELERGDRAVTSASSFDQWFRDVPGVNVSIPHTITLQREGSKFVYAREKPEYFFPIDDQGYGLSMEGLRWAAPGTHNYHFTYELETMFTYTDPANRDEALVFEFTGDDDVWVYINGRLAVDIGGVHGQQFGSVNLDEQAESLGLTPGGSYPLKLFFAERHTSESNFRIETTLKLRGTDLPAGSALAD